MKTICGIREQPVKPIGPVCRTCGGTGTIWSARSWFEFDGYRSSRCGICSGSGESSVLIDREYARWQAGLRAARCLKASPKSNSHEGTSR